MYIYEYIFLFDINPHSTHTDEQHSTDGGEMSKKERFFLPLYYKYSCDRIICQYVQLKHRKLVIAAAVAVGAMMISLSR